MTIEEATEMLKRIYVTEFNTSSIYDNVPNVNLAIEILLTAYEKEKEKNKKIEKELEKHIKFCEQESEGSLNNEICHISLKFNKRLLNILKEE